MEEEKKSHGSIPKRSVLALELGVRRWTSQTSFQRMWEDVEHRDFVSQVKQHPSCWRSVHCFVMSCVMCNDWKENFMGPSTDIWEWRHFTYFAFLTHRKQETALSSARSQYNTSVSPYIYSLSLLHPSPYPSILPCPFPLQGSFQDPAVQANYLLNARGMNVNCEFERCVMFGGCED